MDVRTAIQNVLQEIAFVETDITKGTPLAVRNFFNFLAKLRIEKYLKFCMLFISYFVRFLSLIAPKIALTYPCSKSQNDECADPQAECRSNKCQCIAGFVNKDNVCGKFLSIELTVSCYYPRETSCVEMHVVVLT